MPYVCSIWEVAVETHLLKLLRVQNKILPATDNSPRRILIRDLHVTFEVARIYYYIRKVFRQQVEGIQNRENVNVRHTGQGEIQHRICRRLKLLTVHMTKLPL
jgi:hypothetical protein